MPLSLQYEPALFGSQITSFESQDAAAGTPQTQPEQSVVAQGPSTSVIENWQGFVGSIVRM